MGNSLTIGSHSDNFDNNIEEQKYHIANLADCEIIGYYDDINTNPPLKDPTLSSELTLNNIQGLKKIYIVYQKVNGYSKVYMLVIKILDDNLYVYVTDCVNKKTHLVHATRIIIKSDNDPLFYTKWIQISRDFSLITLPMNGKLNVYNLAKLINNTLEFVAFSGISFIYRASENHLCGIVDGNVIIKEPYKCILHNNSYIIVCSHNDTYTDIITIKHDNKLCDRTMKKTNIGLNIHSTELRFSANGNFVTIFDKSNMNIVLIDLWSRDNDRLIKNVNYSVGNSVCVSDNCDLLFSAIRETNGKIMFKIYNMTNNISYLLNPYLLNNHNLSCDIVYNLVDYSFLSNVDATVDRIVDKIEFNKIHVIVGWNKNRMRVDYWIIQYTNNSELSIITSSSIDIVIPCDVNYMHNNGHMFIYKTTIDNRVIVYDLNNIVSINLTDWMANAYKKKIDDLFVTNYSKQKYYNTINIIGADDSTVSYNLDNYMQYISSVYKNTNPINKDCQDDLLSNEFQLKVTSNINIYNTTKSFNIFQDLLTKRSKPCDVVSNIIIVYKKGYNNIHNVMTDLLNHMYEYTRIIILKETVGGEFIMDEFKNIIAPYIGYVILTLILNYYLILIKIRDKDLNKKSELKLDIIDQYVKNFPIFESFVNKSIDLIVGKN